MSGRIRIAVVYGGRSNEHAISVVSASGILSALDPQKYDVVTLGITHDGAWVRTHVDPAELRIANRQLPSVATPESVRVREASGEVAVFDASSGLALLDEVDVVFPILHGTFGEDGTIQGLFEIAGVPYVGSGVLASAAGMDKVFTKIVLEAAGLRVGRYVVVRRGEPLTGADIAHLGLPVFVKPARSGSSVGISKVRDHADLADALAYAFEHDDKVIIEAGVTGREVECGVLQDADGTVSASVPAEIRLHPDFDWYSFDAKYLDDACEFDVPANLPDQVSDAVREAARQAFIALDCAGLARVDFFVEPDGGLVVNEVNTMPGFTPISMYPRMWAATGVDYAQLVDRLVATALARHKR